jgi:hypothetical protein
MRSRDILHRPRGNILIESTKIKWFARRSSGGGWSLLLEAKSLKPRYSSEVIRLETTKIRWFL